MSLRRPAGADRPGGLDFGPAGGLVVGRWAGLEALGVQAAVTTREGGVSVGPFGALNLALHVGDEPARVLENRRRALGVLGASLDEAVFAEQVHGSRVALVSRADAGRGSRLLADAVGGSDTLLTTATGLVLVVQVADCVPGLLVDPEAGVLAVVHAGWRGTARRAMVAAVRSAVEHGAEPGRLLARLGPAVPAARYPVGRDVAEAVSRTVGRRGAEVVSERRDGPHVDLIRANQLQLEAAGLAPGHIGRAGCSTEDRRFFSDRRARPCGRFALLARLRP